MLKDKVKCIGPPYVCAVYDLFWFPSKSVILHFHGYYSFKKRKVLRLHMLPSHHQAFWETKIIRYENWSYKVTYKMLHFHGWDFASNKPSRETHYWSEKMSYAWIIERTRKLIRNSNNNHCQHDCMCVSLCVHALRHSHLSPETTCHFQHCNTLSNAMFNSRMSFELGVGYRNKASQ